MRISVPLLGEWHTGKSVVGIWMCLLCFFVLLACCGTSGYCIQFTVALVEYNFWRMMDDNRKIHFPLKKIDFSKTISFHSILKNSMPRVIISKFGTLFEESTVLTIHLFSIYSLYKTLLFVWIGGVMRKALDWQAGGSRFESKQGWSNFCLYWKFNITGCDNLLLCLTVSS